MTLKYIRDLYLSVTPNVHHYSASGATGNYIVWAEDGQGDSSFADDKMEERALQGTTDYFTKTEYDPVIKQIETAMNNSDLSWRLSSIQHEEDTGYIHYEWLWEVEESIG
jgi:hypothetical protein